MSQLHAPDRLLDLLADRAVQGLPHEERDELAMLLDAHPGVDEAELDFTAAVLDLALHAAPLDPLPESLQARLLADATDWASRPRRRAERPAGGTDRLVVRSLAPWLLAAAAIALAVIAWLPARTLDPAAGRDRLLSLSDAQLIEWTDPDGTVSGDVVWSNATQTGYMRFKGLTPNDPTDYQYQLWIFDDARRAYSENIAVDGGVFDVDAETGDVIVPIDAKLRIETPALFAVTTEPPGGVVKHNPELDPDRYRIILTAPTS